MTVTEIKKWRVSPKEGGMRLLAFLREKNPDASSVKSLKRAVDGKCVTVNGKVETFSSHPLCAEDVVTLKVKNPQKIALRILYEDEDLLIVDKPAGLVCENRYFAPHLKKRAALIHRLDKETSGALMLAKNEEILEMMIALFRQKGVRKQYLAIVDGNVERDQGKIENQLRQKSDGQKKTIYAAAKDKSGQPAVTLWKCLKRSKTASLLLCEPVTGRTHQLRVHLCDMKHPILGDTHYASHFRSPFHPERHLLHAYTLAFTHPRTNQKISVQAPIPDDFEDALKALFKIQSNELSYAS